MQANRARDTGPSYVYGFCCTPPGCVIESTGQRRPRIDIAFTRRKVAIFVGGCFWHRCPTHFAIPKMNTDFWLEKVDGNVAPDLETTRILTEGGWTVIRFWEHEPSSDAAPRVLQIVRPLPDAMPG